MTILKKMIVLSVFVSLAAFVASANGASATFVQDESSASVVANGVVERTSIFPQRGWDEYRRDILAAKSDEEIDAIVCQMIVQHRRDSGKNLTDEEFKEYLETPEVKERRRQQVENWKRTRENEKNRPGAPGNSQGVSTTIGRIAGYLLIIAFVLWIVRKIRQKKR